MNKEGGAIAHRIHKVGINFTFIQNIEKISRIKIMFAYIVLGGWELQARGGRRS
jgi:hypothetical protein